jgi:hypothetical protein
MKLERFPHVTLAAAFLTLATPIAAAPPPKAEPQSAPAKLDPASASRVADSPLLWYDASNLRVEGKGWRDTPGFYARLPQRAKDFATSQVWTLSANTAGICLRFVTDSTTVAATWDGACDGTMFHMAATGSAGLDLYVHKDSEWKYVGTGRPTTSTTTAVIARDQPAKPAEYLLYLPLYHRVSSLKIGVGASAMIAPAPPRPTEKAKPIVFYGTSITQGGCASRAGMCHPAMLGRWLDREVINLGFSGSGKMEAPLGALFAELDPAVYVLECLPNMTLEMVKERVEPFVLALRAKHPDTPILLVENPLLSGDSEQNVALRDAFKRLQKQGQKKLTLLPSKVQLAGAENGTVDGVHPTDLGFYRMAQAYLPVLKQILAERQ